MPIEKGMTIMSVEGKAELDGCMRLDRKRLKAERGALAVQFCQGLPPIS